MPRLLVAAAPAMNRATPAASGASRQAERDGGVARLVTPSGETRTRRSASSDAAVDASGTATRSATYPDAVGVTVAAKYRVPVSVAAAREIRRDIAAWSRARIRGA